MREQRLELMRDFIQKNKTVTIETLCDTFDISRNTVHRDLNILAQQGLIKKTYGGVMTNQSIETVPFEDRSVKNIDLKRLIAQKAAGLVNPGDSIYIDTGSTAICFFQALPRDYNLTIFTNNIDILTGSIKDRQDTIIFTGGTLTRKTNSVTGTDAVNTLKNYNIGKAFLSATGISEEYGATNSTQGEYQVKRAAIETSRELIMMVDGSKFGVVSLMTFCAISDIDIIITDHRPPDKYCKYFDSHRIKLLLP